MNSGSTRVEGREYYFVKSDGDLLAEHVRREDGSTDPTGRVYRKLTPEEYDLKKHDGEIISWYSPEDFTPQRAIRIK
jgi:hypothetical protein